MLHLDQLYLNEVHLIVPVRVCSLCLSIISLPETVALKTGIYSTAWVEGEDKRRGLALPCQLHSLGMLLEWVGQEHTNSY